MKPIYEPKGRAKEYGELAINIYTGCTHGCIYCYAPLVLKKSREKFHSNAIPRKGIVEAVKRQLDKEQITGKLIHLCFTCDPYPADIDTAPTREVIKAIKGSGNNVQILTKGGIRAERDFDLLDGGDWFGVTVTKIIGLDFNAAYEQEPRAASPDERLRSLLLAHGKGIKTWISLEPVLCAKTAYAMLEAEYIDLYKIGKLNYAKSDINWSEFGREVKRLCIERDRNYYIKDDLKKLMAV